MSSDFRPVRLVLSALAVLAAVSCTSGPEAAPSDTAIGAIAFGRVLSDESSGSGAGRYRHWDAEGNWKVPSQPLWTLQEPLLRCRVLRAVIGRDQRGFSSITVTLTPQDSQRLGEFSTRLLDQQMAVLVDDLVVFAPVVADPLRGSGFELSGGFSPEDARALLARMTRQD